MGRPKGGTNISHSKEEKLALVKRNIAGETAASLSRESGIYISQICKWTQQYLIGGEEALVKSVNQAIPWLNMQTRKTLLLLSN